MGEVTNGRFVEFQFAETGFGRAAAQERADWPDWVGSSSWQKGEAAVHRRLMLERQVTNTSLPDCAIKPPAAEAEEEPMAWDGKKLIRTSAAEFLIFTDQASALTIEARHGDQTAWLTQERMPELFAV